MNVHHLLVRRSRPLPLHLDQRILIKKTMLIIIIVIVIVIIVIVVIVVVVRYEYQISLALLSDLALKKS